MSGFFSFPPHHPQKIWKFVHTRYVNFFVVLLKNLWLLQLWNWFLLIICFNELPDWLMRCRSNVQLSWWSSMPLLEVAEAENWVQLAVLEVMKIGLMLILRLVIWELFFLFFFSFFSHLGGCGIFCVRKILMLQLSSWNQWRFLHAGLGEVPFCKISTSGCMSMTWKFRSLDSLLSKAGLWNLGLTNLELLSCFEIHDWRNLIFCGGVLENSGNCQGWDFWVLEKVWKMSRMRFIAFCLWTKCQTGLLLSL